MNVGLFPAQANGLGVGDEMDIVAALGQFQAQFGGDHTAAAVGGITGDSNLHHGRGRIDALLIDPELHSEHGGNGQRHRGLNITSVAADVGGIEPHRRAHMLVAKFQGERNLVTLKFPAIVGARNLQIESRFQRQLR
jgi:hypothetical protein